MNAKQQKVVRLKFLKSAIIKDAKKLTILKKELKGLISKPHYPLKELSEKFDAVMVEAVFLGDFKAEFVDIYNQ